MCYQLSVMLACVRPVVMAVLLMCVRPELQAVKLMCVTPAAVAAVGVVGACY